MSKQLLLTNVQKAYTDVKAISCDFEVVAPPSITVRATLKMARGKLLSKISLQDKRSEEFAEEQLVSEFLVKDGIVTEHRLRWRDVTNLVLRYKAPFPGGTHTLFVDRDIGNYTCLMASAFQSWVGEDTPRVSSLFPRFILSGELRPDEQINGKMCHVVFWDRTEIDRHDVLYFDSKTFFLVRWDTLYTDVGPKPVLSRSRRFLNIHTVPLPEETWTLGLGEELGAPQGEKSDVGSPQEKGGATRKPCP
ncbi:MAG TPA: hypothetical protein VM487_07150 [Phycisphaerae bacterium]|nr:hypothetical protein [Phycisphaerae bacterium]